MQTINPDNLTRHLRHLTENIGVRLAGTAGEAAAADYVAAEFDKAGARVHLEKFSVQARDVREQLLQVFHDGAWHDAGCSLFANTPGTNGAWVEAPLVFFEGPTGYQQADLAPLMRGHIVLHLGCHIESRENYRRLVVAGPAGVLMVDVRYPGAVPLADAIFPAYAATCGAVPTLNVAFLDAWRWRERRATCVRFRVVGGPRPAESANVIAELPGTDPAAGVLFLGGHHDTQADSVGADDNGSGVAAIIAIAGALAGVPRRRTIRIISFGAEEQLSVGSAVYVRRHRETVAAAGRFMLNFDAFGSHLGWTSLVCNGPEGIGPFLARHLRASGHYVKVVTDLVPYADHFPFVAAGVPAVWIGRNNCLAGRFFHHRPDDDMTRVSCPLVAQVATASAAGLAELATLETLPFPDTVDARTKAAVADMWDSLFGGWAGFA